MEKVRVQLSLQEQDARILKSEAALHGMDVSDFVMWLVKREREVSPCTSK